MEKKLKCWADSTHQPRGLHWRGLTQCAGLPAAGGRGLLLGEGGACCWGRSDSWGPPGARPLGSQEPGLFTAQKGRVRLLALRGV